jgi:uracil-DNA glycosylase
VSRRAPLARAARDAGDVSAAADLLEVTRELAACRLCRDRPQFGGALPHEPRPVFQIDAAARLAVFSQAPGARAHASGRPFSDPSGVRLRAWMGVTEAEFYDPRRVAIVPMGFCFPGHDAHGGDLPPRRECAPHWRARLLAGLPNLQLVLLIGRHAQAWHVPHLPATLTQTVAAWRGILAAHGPSPPAIVLPHPSWRNTGWLKRNAWFEAELVPELRQRVRSCLAAS